MARKRTPLFSEIGLNRPATLKDIAEVAGVSAQTVSNVLLDRAGNYSKDTAREIQKLAKEMGYRRNSLARSLVTRRSNTLGILIEDHLNINQPEYLYFTMFLQQFLKRTTELNYQVKLIQQDSEHEEAVVSQINDGSIDGLVGLVLKPDNKVIPWLEQADYFPSVLVGGDMEHEKPITLEIDNAVSMKAVTEYLLKLGHRRFWFITGFRNHQPFITRYEEFRRILGENGVEFITEHLHSTDSEGKDTTLVMHKFLSMEVDKRPTALVCVNDQIAFSLLKEAEKAGIQIPAEVSLTGFDGFLQGEWSRPTLTTVLQPFEFFGPRAAEILVGFADGNSAVHHEVFPGELVVRDSTDRPKNG